MKRLSITLRFLGLSLLFGFFLNLIFLRPLFLLGLFGFVLGCGLIISIFFVSVKIAKFALLCVAFLLIIGYFGWSVIGVFGASFCYLFSGVGLICSTFFLNAGHNQIPDTNEGEYPLPDNVVSSKSEYRQRVVSEAELEVLLPQGWNVVSVLPSGKVVISNEHIKQSKINTVSDAWYLLPLFFSILGGIIGYVGVKDRDSGKAGSILACGIILFFIEFIVLLALGL